MSKIIKTIKYSLFTFCFVFLLGQSNTLNATHLVGGELSYRCLGNDLYELTLIVRRDCENGAPDAQFDDPAHIGIFEDSGNGLLTHMGIDGRFELPLISQTVIANDVIFDCSTTGSRVCVEEAMYRDTVELPYFKRGYHLAYQRCCRNSILVNIEDPLETGGTYDVSIPAAVLEECNSQPVFNAWPDVYLCVNESLTFDHSAVDADGDILVYRLCTPKQGATSFNPRPIVPSNPPYDDIVWSSTFSESNMIGGNPPLSINSSTGLITGRPNQEGTFVVGVCVEEFRNGVKISEVRRDFEYNVRVCGDAILVGCNVIGNDCDGDTQVTFENTTQGADNYNWTVTDSSGNIITTSMDEDFSYDFPGFGTYTVLLEAMRDSDGCVASEEKEITIGSPDVTADFDAAFSSCDVGNLILLTDLSSDPTGSSEPVSWQWTVNGNSAPNSSTSSYDVGNAQNVEVTLLVTFNSGCTATVTKSFDRDEVFPTIDFTYSINSCGTDSYNLQLNAFSSSLFAIDSVAWTVVDANGTQTGNTNPYDVDILSSGAMVTVVAYFENGCMDTNTGEINEPILPDLVILDNFQHGECIQEDSVKVIFGPGIVGPTINANITSYEWNVNGESFDTEEIEIEVKDGDSLNISLIITYDNGCVLSEDTVFEANFAPELNIVAELDCNNPNGPTVTITDETVFNGSATYTWLLDQVEVSNADSFEFVIGPDGNQVDLLIEYDNGCEGTYSEFFGPIGNPSYTSDLVECLDSSIVVSLTDTSGPSLGVTWEINEDGVITSYMGSPIQFTMTAEQVEVTQTVDYGNGCILTETTILTKDDVTGGGEPELDYSIVPIECFGDSGIFVFTDMTLLPECVFIISQEWVINGMTYTGSPITITLPLGIDIGFIYTVTLSNGQILSTEGDGNPDNDSINTNDIVDQIDIDIVDNGSSICNDSLDLSITNPMTGVDYEWSTDSEFDNIIGTGVSFTGSPGDMFGGTIYVQTINNIGPCVYGQDSITIESDTISISFDMPFIICAGDTANFQVINNRPEQILTFEWKGGDGQLIEGGDTDNPLIGIGEDETEDFFFILCTTNDSGCTSTDTIDFMVQENEELMMFTYEPDSCGSLTIHFDEAPNDLNGNGMWDFGDGTTGTGAMVSHTYDEPGVYTVTLSDTSAVCPKDPISVDVNVANLSIEILGATNDTIVYEIGTTLDVFADTNGNDEDVSWCLEDGPNVGTGNPLEDFDPGMDTILLIAKIIDEFGCEESDTVVLVPEVDPRDCLESVNIDGPNPAVVCEDEEFTLTLTMDEDCDLEDFTYEWNPEDCIVSGNGTPSVVVSTSTSKTIMVLVTHIETGEDSIYNYDIEVSMPQVDISVPELNIDENGNPFVCLGQSIVLTVDPIDPNCTYTWGDGQMGPSIELTPEETATYTVECVDEFGCSSEIAEITIPVIPPQCDESDVYIPNAFSPNGDSNNDVLFVRSKFIQDMELTITNRWGEIVFSSTDQSNGWDGTYKGETLAPDVFAYCIKVTCITGQEYIKAGNVSIIK